MTMPIWRHYEFTNDHNYLKKVAYPIIKGSAEYVLDFLIEDSEGRLVTAPSYSPENTFRMPRSGEPIRISYAPTMDIEIIHALFERVIAASEILGVDREFRAEVESAVKRLPPIQISERDGTIQEWIKDYEEVEPGHRHVSHLFALHPGDLITQRKTPELFEAARKTIERRLNHGGAGTGWSRAWTINFFARLKDGEKAYENILGLLRKSTTSNLFDLHPPFQIDGNFGGTAGVAEMLLQSHEGEIGNRIISILPALPHAWSKGSISGLRARGDFELDINWSDWRAGEIKIKSGAGNKARISYPEINGVTIMTENGKEVSYNVVDDNLIEFDTKENRTYVITDIPDYLPVPDAPEDLSVLRASDSNVNLKWEKTFYASSYSVYRTTQSGEVYQKIAENITDPEYVDQEAPIENGPYYYTVTAVNKSGEGDKSTEVKEKLRNLALGQANEQSSINAGGNSSRAVDGDTRGVWGNDSVSHTDFQDQPWWQVDLGSVRDISKIAVWNRTDCCSERLSDYYILVSDEPFTSDSLDEVLKQPGVWASHQTEVAGSPTTVTVDQPGRYVRIQLAGHNALSLAEVQVFPNMTN